MKTLAILGRQPAIGIAELESLLGPRGIHAIGGGGVILDVDPNEVPFARLGGTIKIARILTTMSTTDWFKLEKYIITACMDHEKTLPDGKLTIGISVYGLDVSPRVLERTALSIKKFIKAKGRPMRIVPNKTREMSTAQIIHNDLTGPNGMEIVLYRDGNVTHVCLTTAVQDIEAYTARDQTRPMRDTRVGMLPPKLAQTIINLATGQMSITVDNSKSGRVESKNAPTRQPFNSSTILDPFCGTGVILQEASLMNYDVYGTDIDPRMVQFSSKNMDWLHASRFSANTNVRIELGDAVSHNWKQPFGFVACEGYLGLPFAHMPSDSQLQESIQSSNQITKGFLKNLASQTQKGFRACIALPAWHVKGKVIHLPCVEQMSILGWKRVEFKNSKTEDLVYHRDDQIVGRELVVITRL